MEYFIVLPVWGDAYLELFEECALPTQLAPGNIPALSRLATVHYLLYSTADDIKRLRNSSGVRELEKYARVQYLQLDELGGAQKYSAQTACHLDAFERAGDHPIIFLTPDSIWSNGTLERLHRIHSNGFDAILVLSFRLEKEGMRSALKARMDQDGVLPIDGPALMELAGNHLHPITESLFLDAGEFNESWPSHVYFRIRGGLVAAGFHIHPVLVRNPSTEGVVIGDTLDGDMLNGPAFANARLYLVSDNRDLMGCELSKVDDRVGRVQATAHPRRRVAEWAARRDYCNKLHHQLFTKPIVFHAAQTLSTNDSELKNVRRTIRSIRYLSILYSIRRSLSMIVRTILRWKAPGADERKAIGEDLAILAMFCGWFPRKIITSFSGKERGSEL